jgi:hypothetical protein
VNIIGNNLTSRLKKTETENMNNIIGVNGRRRKEG